MKPEEKHLFKMVFQLKQKYGHYKLDDELLGIMEEYKCQLSWFERKFFDHHHSEIIQYTLRELCRRYPPQNYKQQIGMGDNNGYENTERRKR